MTGQVSLSSQGQAAGTGRLLRLLLDKQVPIGNRPEGAHSYQPEKPALVFCCRPLASLLQAKPSCPAEASLQPTALLLISRLSSFDEGG